jgi:4-hydroxy-tetrahydrodipicolinate synthase
VGVVSVASHLIGKEIQKIITLFKSGKKKEAEEMDKKFQPLYAAMFFSTNPIPVKRAMQLRGFKTGLTRLPLVPLNKDLDQKLVKVLKEYHII